MSRTIRIEPDQIWVTRKKNTRTPSRRVVDLAGTVVCYSSGGDTTRWCRIRAFRLWIRRYQAIATRPRRRRSLTLRSGGA